MLQPGASALHSLLILACGASPARDPSEALEKGVAEFKAGYETWDRARLENAASIFGAVADAHPDFYEAHYWLGVARFHVALHWVGDGKNKRDRAEIRRALDDAVAPLERAVALNANDCEAHAVLGTLTGLRIAATPTSALRLGRKVLDYNRVALQNGPDNPRVNYLIGTSYFHAPGFLGGREKGLEYFLKAKASFEAEAVTDLPPLQPAWGYGSCLTFIGRTYLLLGQPRQAKDYFTKALSVNPQDKLAQKALQDMGALTAEND